MIAPDPIARDLRSHPPTTASATRSTVDDHPSTRRGERRWMLLGNPNGGKTTLFNRLCGLRAKTGNYPGVTAAPRIGRIGADAQRIKLIDLPGIYGLALDTPDAKIARDGLAGDLVGEPGVPDGVLLVVDSTNLVRHLVLVGEILARKLPTIVALNMIDLARRQRLGIDAGALQRELGCRVVAVSARTGEGLDQLVEALHTPQLLPPAPVCPLPTDLTPTALTRWSESVAARGGTVAPNKKSAHSQAWTDRADRVFTHTIYGFSCFAVVMVGLFFSIFALADYPMSAIEQLFELAGTGLRAVLPSGRFQDLLIDGVLGGIAGTVVFLPQICLLFFLLSLLEDTGYLARAAFLVDRWMRRFGLPGQAFVPLLSSHACALPGILATRLIPDRRDRIATILVAPFMSCSARLPVYTLLIGFLFPHNPLAAAGAFSACYALGALAALASAALARGTLLPGRSRPMVLELPSYKWPSMWTALVTSYDRGRLFLTKAGTVIVVISMVLWWLSHFPTAAPSAELQAVEAIVANSQAELAAAPSEQRESLAQPLATAESEASTLAQRETLEHSFAGRLGRGLEPVFAPLGFDWQLNIAVVTSFAAREVFVSSLLVILGQADSEAEDAGVRARVRAARRDDGQPLLDRATCASLLVFYVLALQCLPTLAVTRREAGAASWALLQFAYMSALAYGAAWLTHIAVLAMGING
ncbi:MAG: ferrous iron transporter B [Planctomycetota bacterium]